MILLIDNYDSFSFNLVQTLGELGANVSVVRNDECGVAELIDRRPTAVVLSPGPGRPRDAGVCLELLRQLPGDVPVLGVCLGHQALVESEGGALELDAEPTHGESTPVHHDSTPLFRGLPSPFQAGRYHSLRARRDTLPTSLEPTAFTADGEVMAVRHTALPRFGVQFHPESILTPVGPRIVGNFLACAGEPVALR